MVGPEGTPIEWGGSVEAAPQEAAFLNAIEDAEPGDRPGPMGAYSDWLRQRGDDKRANVVDAQKTVVETQAELQKKRDAIQEAIRQAREAKSEDVEKFDSEELRLEGELKELEARAKRHLAHELSIDVSEIPDWAHGQWDGFGRLKRQVTAEYGTVRELLRLEHESELLSSGGVEQYHQEGRVGKEAKEVFLLDVELDWNGTLTESDLDTGLNDMGLQGEDINTLLAYWKTVGQYRNPSFRSVVAVGSRAPSDQEGWGTMPYFLHEVKDIEQARLSNHRYEQGHAVVRSNDKVSLLVSQKKAAV